MQTKMTVIWALLFISQMAMGQDSTWKTSAVPIDGFRNLVWGSSFAEVMALLGEKEHQVEARRIGDGKIINVNLTNAELMFGLPGRLSYQFVGNGLSGGSWLHTKSLPGYPVVYERDVTSILNLLTSKYGSPTAYLVNGERRSYSSPQAAYHDYNSRPEKSNITIYWYDAEGNELSFDIYAEHGVLSVGYRAKIMIEMARSNEDF